jgi:hypothetical protein
MAQHVFVALTVFPTGLLVLTSIARCNALPQQQI